MMIFTEAKSQRVYQSALAAPCSVSRQIHLWQPPVLPGGFAIRDLSGASERVDEGNENLMYLSPWDFKRSFTCRKILRHETSDFTSDPKGRCVANFYRLLKSIALAAF
jgi:hypothetical protein